jgi:hypothetical protein
MYVRLNFSAVVVCLGVAGIAAGIKVEARPQDSSTQPADTFFAGIVLDTTSEKIVVSRVVLGKTEKRQFRVTSGTKIEGKLRAKVRVTVRYVTDDDGDTATFIIVRTAQQLKPK